MTPTLSKIKIKKTRDGREAYYDAQHDAYVVKILPGDHYVSHAVDEVLSTVLGSCISACIYDPKTKRGGMNHFMLPKSDSGAWGGSSAGMRFGNFAMEVLINEILTLGRKRTDLEVKIFGGGKIMGDIMGVGDKNIAFINDYVRFENLHVTQKSLGERFARRLFYFPATGAVIERKVPVEGENQDIIKQETRYQRAFKPKDCEIELF
jgi:chemotaxis protein CheD